VSDTRAARWRSELVRLTDLGRTGSAFDHALQLADEGTPLERVLAARWLSELSTQLRPVQLGPFRRDALDRFCGGATPADAPLAGGRAWFPAVFAGDGPPVLPGIAGGALGKVIAARGRPGIRGDLADDARQAVRDALGLLVERRLLTEPVNVTVRAPRSVVRESLQLAVVAAVISIVEDLAPLDDVAFTGALAPDGTVTPVRGVRAKRRVLDEEWPGSLLLVPPEGVVGPLCLPVADLDELLEHLRGRPGVGWDGASEPAAVRAEIERLREGKRYVEASRLAWSLARREQRDLPAALTLEILTAQLTEANNTGAQARALRLADALATTLETADQAPPDVRADALSALGRHDGTLFRLDAAIQRATESLALPLSSQARVRRLRARARAYAEDLNLDEAVRDAEAALTQDSRRGRARSLVELGEWRRRRGELEDAARLAAEAMALGSADRDARTDGFLDLLSARVALDRGDPTTALRIARAAAGVQASPGIELAEVRVRALLALGRGADAETEGVAARQRFAGPFRGSVVGRMLALRQELALAQTPAEQALVRARMWRLPGFAAAYRGRIPDSTRALLARTPY